MQKPPRVTRHNLGAETTLGDLRDFVEMMGGIDGAARVSFDQSFGQRDQVYTIIQVTERDW